MFIKEALFFVLSNFSFFISSDTYPRILDIARLLDSCAFSRAFNLILVCSQVVRTLIKDQLSTPTETVFI